MIKCSACKGPFHPATGHQHTASVRLCGVCATDMARWVKNHTQMMKPITKKNKKLGRVSFYEHAATSVRADSRGLTNTMLEQTRLPGMTALVRETGDKDGLVEFVINDTTKSLWAACAHVKAISARMKIAYTKRMVDYETPDRRVEGEFYSRKSEEIAQMFSSMGYKVEMVKATPNPIYSNAEKMWAELGNIS